MKFSILITSFNKGKYIEECIKSCLNQTEKNLEIIVCDNYSDDNSSLIFKKYEKNITLFRKKKISTYGAVNQIDLIKLGYKNSTGDLLCLLDADDYFYSNKLDIIKRSFTKENNPDVIFDLPIIKDLNSFKKFKLKTKQQKYIWPTIVNTSSITMTREFFKKCISDNIFDEFNLLEVDFRINVYSRCITKNFKIIFDDVSVYRKVNNSIITNIKKYSQMWWIKRFEAHIFLKNIYEDNNLIYNNIVDYNLTKIFSKIFKKFH